MHATYLTLSSCTVLLQFAVVELYLFVLLLYCTVTGRCTSGAWRAG